MRQARFRCSGLVFVLVIVGFTLKVDDVRADVKSYDKMVLDFAKASLRDDQVEAVRLLNEGVDTHRQISVKFKGESFDVPIGTLPLLFGESQVVREMIGHRVDPTEFCQINNLIAVMPAVNSIRLDQKIYASIGTVMDGQAAMRCYLYDPIKATPGELRDAITSVTSGNLELVRSYVARTGDCELIEQPPIGQLKYPGRGGLDFSLIHYRAEVTRFLLECGAHPNSKASTTSRWGGWDGFTPLMLAAVLGDTASMRQLVKAGADSDELDEDGCSAICHAAYANNVEGIELLCDGLTAGEAAESLIAGENSALRRAIRSRRVEAIAELVKCTSRIFGSPIFKTRGDGALLEALTERQYRTLNWERAASSQAAGFQIAKILLANGANPNVLDNNGQPLLVAMIAAGREELVGPLMAAGAVPSLRSNRGLDAFGAARQRKNSRKILKMLNSKD